MTHEQKPFVVIYDTTLRDGMQGIEITYTVEDKIQIAHKLDELGVDYVEGGFPLSNEKEAEFFRRARDEHFDHAKIVAFGSTRKPGRKAEGDPHIEALLEAETEAVIVVGKAWTEHVTKVLKTSLEENLEMIYDSISYLRSKGRIVFFDLEHFFDGYKADPDYALKVLRAGTEAGAECLVVCDTNGGTLPHEVAEIMGALPQKELAPLGVHFHNDTGNAVANSLMGILSGAIHVQGTINGWGERCGNANLCSIMPTLHYKMGYPITAGPHLTKLTAVSRFVAEKANIIPDKRQPYVGEAAFSHKAGQHVDVLLKAEHLMEHMDASLVGNERRILISELAGKSTILKKLSRYGSFTKDSPEVEQLTRLLKEKEAEGYEYEAAEASFEILILKTLGLYKPLFEFDNYHLESFKAGSADSKTVGKLFLCAEDNEVMGAAVKVGPVEALDAALRDALLPYYPFIEEISLTDYRVRVLNPERATGARVRVFISSRNHNGHTWDTVGVHENIIEASWQALVDSYDYYYNIFVLSQRNTQ
ncbi:2-isopropylmalate synthase/homocitrate synthase family protein [Spirochaeta thermophila DSM 6578]|uniref:Citramalate synthase n=1 Tax=Winmispira thermophila (strain ATCC 700085 / DSM 6578 / Z-1203) TaxID=869211 RepID=G0GCF6_WINT7|nr:citramalate synthase [Spirochaeta thermophila]AEJ61241.1 2-isopropylmalate synthase/homocitrate synthase family protein [Spirochaeta thermophila DSM 6578]